MDVLSAGKRPSIMARMETLRRRRRVLGVRIFEELSRPAPCSIVLQTLKRQRLDMKDEIARYHDMLRRMDAGQSRSA